MSARIVPLAEGPEIPVGGVLLVIGRHPDCDFQLPSILVSRRHCCLIEVNGDVLVRDLGSSNGTQINGRRVASGRLKRGDELTIADLRYRLDEATGSAARASQTSAESKGEGSLVDGLEGTKLHGAI